MDLRKTGRLPVCRHRPRHPPPLWRHRASSRDLCPATATGEEPGPPAHCVGARRAAHPAAAGGKQHPAAACDAARGRLPGGGALPLPHRVPAAAPRLGGRDPGISAAPPGCVPMRRPSARPGPGYNASASAPSPPLSWPTIPPRPLPPRRTSRPTASWPAWKHCNQHAPPPAGRGAFSYKTVTRTGPGWRIIKPYNLSARRNLV